MTRAEIIDNTITEMRRLQDEIDRLKIALADAERLRDEWCEAYTSLRDERAG